MRIYFGMLLGSFILVSPLALFAANLQVLQEDGQGLLSMVDSRKLQLEYKVAGANEYQMHCTDKTVTFRLQGAQEEVPAMFYALFRRMGYLFPHPRKTVVPGRGEVQKVCGKKYPWKPRLKDRGFHLHTQHPSEWISGFFEGQQRVALDYIWWLARNQQNRVEIELIRSDPKIWKKTWPELLQVAHSLEIQVGVSLSFSLQQQKSYRLIPFWRSLFNWKTREALQDRINQVLDIVDLDFVTVELGETEFHSSPYEKTLTRIEWLREALAIRGKKLMVKIHVSSGQYDSRYGNFNFLPQYSDSRVGVLPHTVHFYGLDDKYTPMYGRQNFQDIQQFMIDQNKIRETWYFPETAYYCGLDIDIPLFLTDYLVARAQDMEILEKHQIPGQLVFSTGQEMGYWLFDWTIALWTDSHDPIDPMLGLKLLGESPAVWSKWISWQTKYIKDLQVIQMITPANLMDELDWFFKPTHQRLLLKHWVDRPQKLQQEIQTLEQAVAERPPLEGLKDPELAAMMAVTSLRMDQALALRKSVADPTQLAESRRVRQEAAKILIDYESRFARWKDTLAYDHRPNWTSYPEGYARTAIDQHFWIREENQIRDQNFFPFRFTIYDPFAIVF
ncbi:MAG: hypothetical protein COT73_10710 [Bdellovibrio sp. CG10_big_fil_rev_8_21_14_0_10_47_8]|nr:MAG: hypothetical protein COT73_10710 [Bdellovibrio sp. CG10_big_fil_rev_8_21_14_0_10_47_8]